MTTEHAIQRIARLTPLTDVLARVDALVTPVPPRRIEIAAAVGRVLAEDVIAPLPLPSVARALRDGYAVRAESLGDAGPYTPAILPAPPVRIDAGEILPSDADAVVPIDAIVARANHFEATAAVVAGEGVLAPAADIRAGEPLRRAGERLRRVDAAVLSATRLAPLAVRAPDIRIVNTRAAHDAILDAACALIAGAVTAGGGKARREGENLEQVLGETDGDAVIAVGGTGSGHGDASVRTLARHGRVEVHGVALLPGETAAFGLAGARPVLLVPGRIDAALAVWLTIGRRMLCRLAGATEAAPATKAVLARKVASPLGFTELIPLRCREGKAKPIASGYWPLAAIVQSDGWMMVPADSEGYPAATEVVVRPWP